MRASYSLRRAGPKASCTRRLLPGTGRSTADVWEDVLGEAELLAIMQVLFT